MIGVSLFGEWARAAAVAGRMESSFRRAAKQAVMREAQYFRGKIVKGIRDQAPGEEAIKPLSPITIAIRQFMGFNGTKALIVRADLINNITASSVPDPIGAAFVGVLRKARNKAGQPLVNIAELNEFGSGPIVIPITPASSRFFHAALTKAGLSLPSGEHTGHGATIAIVRIPARPFLRPAFEKYEQPAMVRERFTKVMAEAIGDFIAR